MPMCSKSTQMGREVFFLCKVQLISKGHYGIINSSKKRTKKMDLRYHRQYCQCYVEIFRFLKELKIPKSIFEIN